MTGDTLFQLSIGGISLVAVLYYLNQAVKRAGYVPSKWILALTIVESATMVGLFFFAPKWFEVVYTALALAALIVLFHDGVKAKAKEPTE